MSDVILAFPPLSQSAAHRATPSGALRSHFLSLYARNSVSTQLDDTLDYYALRQHAGLIGYQRHFGVAVVLGDPICAEDAMRASVEEFLRTRPELLSRALFVSASQGLADALRPLGFGAIPVGEEAVFDLASYSFTGGTMKRIRYHESRARRRGVTVVNLDDASTTAAEWRGGLDTLTRQWQDQHAAGPMGFLLALRPLNEPDKPGKRVLVAMQDGRPIAYLTALPVPARNGIYLEDYVRSEDVPDGTIEMLFIHACTWARESGFDYVSLGTAPLANVSSADHREHPVIGKILTLAYERMSWPYDFKSLVNFKSRFHPTRWEPKYLVYEKPFTPRAAMALAAAYLPPSALLGIVTRSAKRLTSRRAPGRAAAPASVSETMTSTPDTESCHA